MADTSNDRIQKFDSSGTFIEKWGSGGSAEGEFAAPSAVAVDYSGNVYVTDSYNNRVQKFLPGTITVTSPNGGETWTAGSTKDITWKYEGNPGTTVEIQLFRGATLDRTIKGSTSVGSAGTGSFSWPMPAGLADGNNYKIKIISNKNPAINDMSNKSFTISH